MVYRKQLPICGKYIPQQVHRSLAESWIHHIYTGEIGEFHWNCCYLWRAPCWLEEFGLPGFVVLNPVRWICFEKFTMRKRKSPIQGIIEDWGHHIYVQNFIPSPYQVIGFLFVRDSPWRLAKNDEIFHRSPIKIHFIPACHFKNFSRFLNSKTSIPI